MNREISNKPTDAATMEKMEEIRKLKSLLDQGAISEEEFSILKKRVLSSIQEIDAKKDLSAKAKKPPKKKVVSKGFEPGNEITVNLLKIALGLSLGAGVFFWIRYESFVAFIILALIGIGVSMAIPKLIPKLLLRNLLLGLVSVVMVLLIVFPIGGTSSSSSESSSSHSSSIKTDDLVLCPIHHIYYDPNNSYKRCPKCVDDANNKAIDKAREKFNHL